MALAPLGSAQQRGQGLGASNEAQVSLPTVVSFEGSCPLCSAQQRGAKAHEACGVGVRPQQVVGSQALPRGHVYIKRAGVLALLCSAQPADVVHQGPGQKCEVTMMHLIKIVRVIVQGMGLDCGLLEAKKAFMHNITMSITFRGEKLVCSLDQWELVARTVSDIISQNGYWLTKVNPDAETHIDEL